MDISPATRRRSHVDPRGRRWRWAIASFGSRRLAIGVGAGLAVAVWVTFGLWGGNPVDASCYYHVPPTRPYDGLCFVYSPPVALAMGFLREVMPFEVFTAGLRAIELAILVLITGPLAGVAVLLPPVVTEVNAANVNLILVAALLASFRHPWAWSLLIVTKVTPGIGLLWFAVRREWRSLGIALAATGALVLASLLVAPELWPQYLQKLGEAEDSAPWPVWVRLPFAAALVVWGARTNRRWTLVLALYLSLPRLYLLSPVVLVGLAPFLPSAERLRTALANGRLRLPGRELRLIPDAFGFGVDLFHRGHHPVNAEALVYEVVTGPGDRVRERVVHQ